MNTQTIFRFFILTLLVVLAPTVVVAGQASNAYVTVKTDKGDVTLSGDDMNFHLSAENGPVRVEVKANAPYILLSPKPNWQDLSPHQTMSWMVRCEDGEIYGAEGSIGFCQCTIIPPPDIEHEFPPTIHNLIPVSSVPSTTNQEDPRVVRRKWVKIEMEPISPGYHQTIYKYQACPVCGKTPKAIEHVKTWLDEFEWHRIVPTPGGDIVLPGKTATFNGEIIFPANVGMVTVRVRGKNKYCKKCYSYSQPLDIMAP